VPVRRRRGGEKAGVGEGRKLKVAGVVAVAGAR